MYNSSQSKTGGVVLKCKACAHSEGVNEFDDRQGSRRTQAAQAMMNHTRNGHRKEPVGSPVSKDLESWVCKVTMTTVWAMLGDVFNIALVLDGWMRMDDYIDGHGLVAMVRTNPIMRPLYAFTDDL
jgi:hypothetical protein